MPRKGKRNSKKKTPGVTSTAPGKRVGRPPNPTVQKEGKDPKPLAEPPSPLPTPSGVLPVDDKVAQLMEAEKQAISKLEALEKGIYDYEAKYLARVVPGNVVRGYGSWLGSGSQSAPLMIRDEDRIFSRSSLSGNRHLEALGSLPGVTETRKNEK